MLSPVRAAEAALNHIPSRPTAGRVACRQIRADDRAGVAALLHEGFPRRSASRWMAALDRLAARPTPAGFPTFGHMIEANGEAVGALLTIATAPADDASAAVRCNLSSWYVRPDYRFYAATLTVRAVAVRGASYLNVSPAEITWPTIEAQGFRRFSDGVFAAVPLLSRRGLKGRTRRVTASGGDGLGLPASQLQLLRDHAAYGCISVCCETSEGVFGFVFRRRIFRHHPLPCAQLIYAAAPTDLARCANLIGRFLAVHGISWVLVGANGPIDGFRGRYFGNKMPMYCLGSPPAHPGDIAYTEAALLGL